jgi:hypothetical protein
MRPERDQQGRWILSDRKDSLCQQGKLGRIYKSSITVHRVPDQSLKLHFSPINTLLE